MHNRFPARFCHHVTCALLFGLFLQFATTADAQSAVNNAANDTASDKAISKITDPATVSAVKQAQQNGNPVVALHTNLGTMHLELYPEKSPKSVENFVKYVQDNFYDGTIFHRVIEGFMIQGGGLDLRLEKKKTRDPVLNEADNGLRNEKFTIAMARTGAPHSATAQFFINTADNDFLNHKAKEASGWGYAVIGRMIGGKRIAEWMSKAPTGPAGPFPSDVPVTPMVIEKATVLQ